MQITVGKSLMKICNFFFLFKRHENSNDILKIQLKGTSISLFKIQLHPELYQIIIVL